MEQQYFSRRNHAIDLLRAMVMVLMVFVNDLWRITSYPRWLGHAAVGEDFLGLSDIVFPCFLFVVGMSIPYALEGRDAKGKSTMSILSHIFTRSLALIVMGVFLVNTESGMSPDALLSNTIYKLFLLVAFFLIWNYKSNKWFQIAGVALLLFLAFVFKDPKGGYLSARWWGILGLIGWSYLFCALTYLFTRARLKYIVAVWGALLLVNMLLTPLREGISTSGSRLLFGLPKINFLGDFTDALHVGNGHTQLLTMSGVMLSVISMKLDRKKAFTKALAAIVAVIVLLLATWLTRQWWIIDKIGGSLPWVLVSSAIAVGMYALLSWLVTIGKAGWLSFLRPAGTSTLTCYIMPHLLYSLMTIFGFSTPAWMNDGIVGIINCICFSLLCLFLTWLFGKMGLKLKI
ncbi:MAG: DUF5009 domain-containing protein [Bacteroidales bacterium]|jgi:heparan-alpha-glucosaminide N-acetyltransferase|nr:DUF5009 domain-containing protein [Bacteroidales bacterium]